MEKSVKFAIGIYLAAILIVTTLYLSFILVGSLQGKDMSNSVLDTDHTKINNKTRNSDEAVDSSLKMKMLHQKNIHIHLQIIKMLILKTQISINQNK